MQNLKEIFFKIVMLFIFWVLLFDFQRILFSIHNWNKLEGVSISDWLLTFIYSLPLDLATTSFLCILPILLLILCYIFPNKIFNKLFISLLFLEVLFTSLIHAGEINAYPEWNHKLTSRVFMHLSNPDEVTRTADYSMTLWFIVYSSMEVFFAIRMYQWFLNTKFTKSHYSYKLKSIIGFCFLIIAFPILMIIGRGGFQQIPINIDSAYFSKKYIVNDISVNSTYYFVNSYFIYKRSNIDELIPKINPKRAEHLVNKMYSYKKKHSNYILKSKRPNVVFVVLESWAANAIGCLSNTKNATPNFDQLASEGLLFTNIYSSGHTSEIGNTSIFSGYPALPGISISLQPEKHRKLRSLNQDLREWGYSSNYLFSGDLKYGNIGSYFIDHGFDKVLDENNFPSNLERGKLNYYDEDLYEFFIQNINKTKEPFMHCAFTGSTHSPYDHPKGKTTWKGLEGDFMNSIIYADGCLSEFISKAKNQDWFSNTIFIFVADHGHGTPDGNVPHNNSFYRIPLLFWGEPLKEEYKGKRIDKIGSQSDIAATLLYQMGGDLGKYPWSKDLLNHNAPEFAFHTIINGFGWVTPKGEMAYQMYLKHYNSFTFPKSEAKVEQEKCHAFLYQFYQSYKNL